jgi:hypothetical protein
MYLFLYFCAVVIFRNEINLALLQMKESGELEDLERKWFKERNECGSLNEEGAEQVRCQTKHWKSSILEGISLSIDS